MAASSLTTKIRWFLRPPRRYIYVAALVTSIVRYWIIRWFLPQFDAGERLLFSVASFLFILFMWESVDSFNRYLNQRLPFESGPLRRFFVQAGTCLLVLLIIQTALVRSFKHYYDDYIPLPFANIMRIAAYGLNVFLVLAVNTAYFGFYFFEKWKKNLLERETWEKEKAVLHKQRLNAQYENLKNQLNPHFLFNSLSSLDSLIDENPVLARQFLQQLSRVYRYVLQHKDKELVPLETELTFIKNYVSLLETRFDGTFQLRCSVSNDALERRIVPVTLQILIENAIKHNVISEASPLIVHLTSRDGYLEVTNAVQRKRQIATSNGQGLQDLQQLYSYLSEVPVLITQENDTFRVRVPLLP